jgi:ankyrin repeat protein
VPELPPRPDLDQLRRIAKDRLRAAREGDAEAISWIGVLGGGLTLASAQLRLARHYGFASWPALQLEVARRIVLDLHDAQALATFIAEHPTLATADLEQWQDHPQGASPLGYIAMARYDTATHTWHDVPGTGAAAHVLIAAGAPVDGQPGDSETPLITAASYGDADVAAVLIASGADLDATASEDGGGVPGGSALLHAAVFGMTDVLDLLVAAGARIRSIEEAAAIGDVSGWLTFETPIQARVRALVMAADHQRIAAIEALIGAGTPVDDEDELFGRHPLRLAAANGRPASVRSLLALGADPELGDANGLTPLDHCRRSRAYAIDPTGHNEVETLLDSRHIEGPGG